MIHMYRLRITVLLASWMMAGILSAQSFDRPSLPAVALRGDQGGFADGRPWIGPPKGSQPTVVAILYPDREDDLDLLTDACALAGIAPSTLQWHAIYLTRATWMPDRLLQFSHWVRKMGASLEEARTEGIVQAFLIGRPDRWEWETVYDREHLLLGRWKLSDVPFQVLVIGKDGRLLGHKSGDLSSRTSPEWGQKLREAITRPDG